MKKAYPKFSVSELCCVLSVSMRSFYYKEVKKTSDAQLCHQIHVISAESFNTYGKRRIQQELAANDVRVSLYKVAKIMKALKLYVRYPRKKHFYPDAGKELRFAPNLLNRKFNPETHNTRWVTDVTYIRSHQGWSYLACVLDLATKEIVGFSVSRSPDTALTLAALNQAITKKRPDTTQLLVHSDQGCHFSSHAYRNRLSFLKIKQSMSRRGNCWDNAVMERFFRTLKSESLNGVALLNHQSVVSACERYINFYNYKRRHSGLGYLTPHQCFRVMSKAA